MSESRPGTFTGEAGQGTAQGESRSRAVTAGYSMLMPGGWRQIPVQRRSERVIDAIASEVVGRMHGRLSRDKLAQHRIELKRRLSAIVKQARRGGAVDLYLPVQYIHGLAVPASIVVAHGSLRAPEGAGQAGLVALLVAQGGDTTAVTVDGTVAARREHTEGPEKSQEFAAASRRVDYLLPVPGTRDDWLIITFVTLGSDDPDGEFAKLLVEWFDAVVSTFRWTADPDIPGPASRPEHVRGRG